MNIRTPKTLATSILAIGLYALPSFAFTGSMSEVNVNAVTCLNHTTGDAVPAEITPSGFSCSLLPTQAGDNVGIVASGMLGGTTPQTPSGCTTVQELEPNDAQPQDIGLIAAGGCITVHGTISGALETPNADGDFYGAQLNGVSRVRLELPETTGSFAVGVWDEQTGQSLTLDCQQDYCEANVQSDAIIVGIGSDTLVSYNLKISDATASGPVKRDVSRAVTAPAHLTDTLPALFND